MRTKGSAVTVWLTLGFVLGLGFTWLYQRGNAPAPRPDTSPAVTAPVAVRQVQTPYAGTLAEVEREFQRWGGYAVWEDDVAEFAH